MKKHKKGAGRSLNLVLWFTFVAFALILVVIFMAVQSLLVGNQYREKTISLMREASGRMTSVLDRAEEVDFSAWQELRTIEDTYDVRFRLLDPSGRNVFSDGSEEETFPEIAEALKNSLNVGDTDVVLSLGSTLAYATVVTVRGQTYFLYLSSSLSRLNTLENSLRWLTLAAALFSVALAFVASGLVAMLITKPVTEVTEQAKELARGHYDLEFKRDYFCLEMSELSDALEYAREEISKADSMQKELIANVSHDFKTPLTMIKGYASMILEISGEDKEKREAHARVIIDESDRLAALVGDLLDLSRLRSGVGAQAPTVFNLSDLVYKIADRFAHLTETQGFEISVEAEEALYACADRERIEQVVYNLIGNAVNYTGDDKRVFIRLFAEGKVSRFEVEDTGRGIPSEELETIWDRYYRSRETHKRPVQGTGLGLSIVKSILQTQGCPFGVKSELGKGSVFWVEFPFPPEESSIETEERRAGRRKGGN